MIIAEQIFASGEKKFRSTQIELGLQEIENIVEQIRDASRQACPTKLLLETDRVVPQRGTATSCSGICS